MCVVRGGVRGGVGCAVGGVLGVGGVWILGIRVGVGVVVPLPFFVLLWVGAVGEGGGDGGCEGGGGEGCGGEGAEGGEFGFGEGGCLLLPLRGCLWCW